VWVFKPDLAPGAYARSVHSAAHVRALSPAGLAPDAAGTPAEVTFKVQSANVTTSQAITATFRRKSAEDQVTVPVSMNNGLKWKEVWKAEETGTIRARIDLVEDVNGAYDTLIRVRLLARNDAADAALEALEVQTTTALNAKTQPRLNLGRNTVYVGAGEQTDSIVLWPELQNDRYKDCVVEEKNVKSVARHLGYQGAVYPDKAREDAYLVYRLDAPADLRHVTWGGRFYNRAPRSHIDLLHSFDGGRTWERSWSLTRTEQPWDVIHYETVNLPLGCRSVLLKYLMNTTDPSPSGCGIYALRI
jgi:hypothetical protein